MSLITSIFVRMIYPKANIFILYRDNHGKDPVSIVLYENFQLLNFDGKKEAKM